MKKFQCDECSKQCKSQKHYENHKYYHKKILKGEQVICEICQETVSKYFINQHHKRKHVDKSERKFECNLCPYGTYLKVGKSQKQFLFYSNAI